MADCYDNRELSWLKFNERVLEEAQDNSVPLFERLGFASIFQSNLDEFFMIRVGSLYDQLLLGKDKVENKTNMSVSSQLSAIFERVRVLEPKKDEAYSLIMQLLRPFGVEQYTSCAGLPEDDREYLRALFEYDIRHLLSPLIIDKRNPFPFLKNKEIYIATHLESKSGVKIGILPLSELFERIIRLPGSDKFRFMLAEDLILEFAPLVFDNYKVLDKALIRVTRNADINVEEALFDHDVDYRDVMEELLKRRKKLSPVRLQVSGKFSRTAVMSLCDKLYLTDEQVFSSTSPLDLSFIWQLADLVSKPELRYPKLTPQKPACISDEMPVAPQIRKKDVLLSYPYESIRPFIRMLREAADDPDVISVKITLYRLAKNSAVIDSLVSIAEKGKEVLVLVELRARFDEENNIGWSRRLQNAGCTVIFGPKELKVHSKLLLITRKSGDGVEYITQIGTGNYNEKTSTLYTDLSLITANPDIGAEASKVFSALSTETLIESSEHLLVAPLALQNRVVELIDEQAELARQGKRAYIGCKLNSLTDKVIIDKLIEASCAGVETELLIRGICCLVAGIEGVTENISVTSIVGRFLEHSRIYIFGCGDERKIYISSADFMTRNTLRRVEVAAPVYDKDISRRIYDMFKLMLRDNVKARHMQPDGTYKRAKTEGIPLETQLHLYANAYDEAKKEELRRRQSETPPPPERKTLWTRFLERLIK